MEPCDSIQDIETKYFSFSQLDEIPHLSVKEMPVTAFPDGTKPLPLGSGYITGILGVGGMSVVYEIWNKQLGVKRAVKLLRPNSAKEIRKLFDKEIKITAQLDHPNIISIHSVGSWNNTPFIEMEMIDGFSLSELIKEKQKLPLDVCVSIGIFICKALYYTHNHDYSIDKSKYKGLMHRDLKPGNILISRNGVVRLTDFGIASPVNVQLNNVYKKKIIGSIQYLAPEQLRGDPIDQRVDIFSFGCVLYEILTGEMAFSDKNLSELLQKRINNKFKPISSYQNKIPRRLVSLVNKCLQMQPDKRPKDIAAVLKTLTNIHHKLTSKSPTNIIKSYVQGKSMQGVYKQMFPKVLLTKVAVVFVLILNIAVCGLLLYRVKIKNLKKPQKTQNIFTETEIKTQKNNVSSSVRSIQLNSKEILAHPEKQKTKTIISKEILNGKPKKTNTSDASQLGKHSTTHKSLENENSLSLMRDADKEKKYSKVIELHKGLSPIQSSTTEVRLLTLRALVGTKQINQAYFNTNTINDGEFNLTKAQFLYNAKKYEQAIAVIIAKNSFPALLIDKNVLHTKNLYLIAQCYTAIFNANPTTEGREMAMNCWFKVKNRFRKNQNDPVLTEVNSEIRKISKNTTMGNL